MEKSDDYYYDDKFFCDDFHLDVRKKEKPKQKQNNAKAPNIFEKIKNLPLKPTFSINTKQHLQKLVIDKKIKDIGKIIKNNINSIEIEAIANVNVKPFEEFNDEHVKIIIFEKEENFIGPIHAYSRCTPIGGDERDEIYEPVVSNMKFDHEWLTLLRLHNIVISKIMKDSKSIEQIIKENPTKIVKIFQEILNLVLDVEVRDHYFWSHNSNGADNILWWNQKWIILNGEFKVSNAGFISNLIKVLDLFRVNGMSMKQLENELWKAFQDNVWRRRPRYVYTRIRKQYFKEE
ncbi:hypothetical protein PVAND_006933 [Polypedilum vanderplanki]|uniref:Uncharacterized protein n=1 Tax=Polypedilum vanderplanki TaxID=319348 RepID=A0A9J6C594_POLVA|nr:hypothetical protein PVAND_006933 [Polypedilum vanderplanki]